MDTARHIVALLIVLPLSVVGLYVITVLEERELRARFGGEYVTYSARVPRFFPHQRVHTD